MSEENIKEAVKQDTDKQGESLEELSPQEQKQILINTLCPPGWLFDPIKVVGVESKFEDNKTKIAFTIEFSDFMGLSHRIVIQREDIYLNWSSVLTSLIRQGYRFNIVENGELYVRALLAHTCVDQKETEKALERNKYRQDEKQEIAQAAQKMVQQRANLMRRISN